MTTYELTTRAPAATVRVARPPDRFRWLRELGLLVGLYAGYSVARLLGDADLAGATANAHDLLALERSLHIDIEAPANSALQAWPLLAIVASYWYSLLHYVVTPAVLVWVYRRRHGDYRAGAQRPGDRQRDRPGRLHPAADGPAADAARASSTRSPRPPAAAGGAATPARPRGWAR